MPQCRLRPVITRSFLEANSAAVYRLDDIVTIALPPGFPAPTPQPYVLMAGPGLPVSGFVMNLQAPPQRPFGTDTALRGKTLLCLGFAQALSLPDTCPYASVHAFPALTPALLAQYLPDAIALPLFGAQADASTQLHLLRTMGFRGRCFVLAPRLPNPKLVLAELRAEAPGLRIALLAAQP